MRVNELPPDLEPEWDDAGEEPTTPLWIVLVMFFGAITFAGAGFYGFATGNSSIIGAVIVAAVLFGLTMLLARLLSGSDDDPTVVPLLLAAFVVKMFGSLVRYWVAYTVYKGGIDATDYDHVGRFLAQQFRSGNFNVDLNGRITGTNFMRAATGVMYTFVPASRIAGFLVFAFIAFLGNVLYWRAFKAAVPDGAHRRYALLVFLLPSLVYWPSSIGKEAWMTLGLGLCSFGVARIFVNRPLSGILILGLGLVMCGYVRPHLALAVFAGLLLAVLLRKRASRNPVVPLIALGLLMAVGVVLVQQSQTFLGVPNLTQEAIQQKLDETTSQTSEGGSAFTPIRVRTPVDFPAAFVTVFFRPFPFEVHSFQGMLTGAEGLILLGLSVVSWRRIASTIKSMRQHAYVAYAFGFVIVFVIAFSAFGNFGILARERTQALPLYLVLLALPPRPPRRPRDDETAPFDAARTPALH